MPTLYFHCGLPFSGKSMLARRLSQRLGCPAVGFDAINRERGLGYTLLRDAIFTHPTMAEGLIHLFSSVPRRTHDER